MMSDYKVVSPNIRNFRQMSDELSINNLKDPASPLNNAVTTKWQGDSKEVYATSLERGSTKLTSVVDFNTGTVSEWQKENPNFLQRIGMLTGQIDPKVFEAKKISERKIASWVQNPENNKVNLTTQKKTT